MQKENKVIVKLNCFPARSLAARRVGVSRFFVSDRRSSVRSKIGRCRITAFRQDSLFYHSGFTLIELLVVVLIIGILAAVALPQYQKAVTKSRYASMKHVVQSLYEAEKAYYLATGEYTQNLDELPVDFPRTHSWTNSGGFGMTVPNVGSCAIQDTRVYCNNTTIKMAYHMRFDNEKAQCLANENSAGSISRTICAQETGLSAASYGSNDGGWYYNYP